MRITVFLFFFCIVFSHAATSHSQEAKLSLHLKSTTIKEACKEIEKQSGLVFVFADNTEDATEKKVNIRVSSRSISNIMDNLLSDTGLEYRILDKQVVLYKEEKKIDVSEIRTIILEEKVQQQKKTITGKVRDNNSEAIIGANIMEKGTTNGTVTDIDGNFTLSVENNAVLHVSYIGYITQDIPTTGRTILEIVLQEDLKSLDEVVVVAFGKMKKEAFTGSAGVMKSDDLVKAQVSNPASALAGRVAGVQLSNSSSQLGSSPSITIRGFGSISSDTEPLIVVDGMPFDGDLNLINSSDIESMTVLKDAASNALYGARGANGVIMITTKRGTSGDAKITFDSKWASESSRYSAKNRLFPSPERWIQGHPFCFRRSLPGVAAPGRGRRLFRFSNDNIARYFKFLLRRCHLFHRYNFRRGGYAHRLTLHLHHHVAPHHIFHFRSLIAPYAHLAAFIAQKFHLSEIFHLHLSQQLVCQALDIHPQRIDCPGLLIMFTALLVQVDFPVIVPFDDLQRVGGVILSHHLHRYCCLDCLPLAPLIEIGDDLHLHAHCLGSGAYDSLLDGVSSLASIRLQLFYR
ncbi:STN domain-containing protein [Proteiniphilum saccharofermentans]|nr:STN domain-containing protein [Proteiniphilum saccharofermentans]